MTRETERTEDEIDKKKLQTQARPRTNQKRGNAWWEIQVRRRWDGKQGGRANARKWAVYIDSIDCGQDQGRAKAEAMGERAIKRKKEKKRKSRASDGRGQRDVGRSYKKNVSGAEPEHVWTSPPKAGKGVWTPPPLDRHPRLQGKLLRSGFSHMQGPRQMEGRTVRIPIQRLVWVVEDENPAAFAAVSTGQERSLGRRAP